MEGFIMKKIDVAIIGGGASGLAAAITAARKGACVAIFERNHTTGKKLSLTGNGKCNITNANCLKNNWDTLKNSYFSNNVDFVKNVIDSFDAEDTVDFFKSIGLFTKRKADLYFPQSEQASTVSDLLKFTCEEVGVEIYTGYMVNEIDIREDSYRFLINRGEFAARIVVISTGGNAYPKSGSDGSGYGLAKKLGHCVIPTGPALTGLRCRGANFKDMSGARIDAKLTMLVGGKVEREESGNLQLTDYGLSGIPVFQLSRHAQKAIEKNKNVQISIDFLPDKKVKELKSDLTQMVYCNPGRTILQHLIGFFSKKIAQSIIFGCGFQTSHIFAQEDIETIANKIKDFRVDIVETNGFDNAQVTCGGIDTREINSSTMESRLVSGLYFSGEIIDTDGICGGYNLQFAWATGFLAGSGAAESLKEKSQR